MNQLKTDQTLYEARLEAHQDHGEIPEIDYFGNVLTHDEVSQKIDDFAKGYQHLGVDIKKPMAHFGTSLPAFYFGQYGVNGIGTPLNLASEVMAQRDASYLTGSETETALVLDLFANPDSEMTPNLLKSLGQAGIKQLVVYSLLDDTDTEKMKFTRKQDDTPGDHKLHALHMAERAARLVRQDSLSKIIRSAPKGMEIVSYAELMEVGAADKSVVVPIAYEPNRLAFIYNTSGTTGKPKGSVATNERIIGSINDMYFNPKVDLGIHPGDRHLLEFPPNHKTVNYHGILGPSMLGATFVPYPFYDPAGLPQVVWRKNIQLLIGAPSHAEPFAREHNGVPDGALAGQGFQLYSGGEYLHGNKESKINAGLDRMGCETPVKNGSGLTEYTPSATLNLDAVTGTTGRLLPGKKARIRDMATGEILTEADEDGIMSGRPGLRGYVECFDPHRSPEYYKNPEKTAEFFTEDGYGCPEDVGLFDAEGRLIIHGRGQNRFTGEDGKEYFVFDVERAVYDNTQLVFGAAAVKIKSAGQEIPVVHIIPESEHMDIEKSVRSIMATCAVSLPPAAMPQGYRFLGENEFFPTGEITHKRDDPKLAKIAGPYYTIHNDQLYSVDFDAGGPPTLTLVA